LTGFVANPPTATLIGGTIDSGGGQPTAALIQVVPQNLTVTSLAFSYDTSVAQSLVGSTLTLTAQLYRVDMNSYLAVPLAGAFCDGVPALTGVVAAHTRGSCQVTGLSIPVASSSGLFVVVSATATGVALINSVPLDAVTVGVGAN
jgi:hypothetical protein